MEDAHRLLIHSAASDGQNRESSSPCQTLIELVRESHLGAFPTPSPAAAPPCPVRRSSNSWMTSPELGTAAAGALVVPTGGGHEHGGQLTADGHRSSSTTTTTTQDANALAKQASEVSRIPVATSARTTLSISSPFGPSSESRFSPSVQPHRASVALVSAKDAAVPVLPASATSALIPLSASSRHHNDYPANPVRISPQISTAVSQLDARCNKHTVGRSRPSAVDGQSAQLDRGGTQVRSKFSSADVGFTAGDAGKRVVSGATTEVSPEMRSSTSVDQKVCPRQRSTSAHPSLRHTQVLNLTPSAALSLTSSSPAVAAQSNATVSSSTLGSVSAQARSTVRPGDNSWNSPRQLDVYKASPPMINGFVTAALDSAIELLTSRGQRPIHAQLDPAHYDNVNIAADERNLAAELESNGFGYDLVDDEPTRRGRGQQTRSTGQRVTENGVSVARLVVAADGGRTVSEELEAVQRRRAIQLQRTDDSFERAPTPRDDAAAAPPGEPRPTTSVVLPLPRDSAIARHRRRRRAVVTSSSSSSRDPVTSSSTSPSPDRSSSPETRPSPPTVARHATRRRRRLHDPA